MDSKTIKALRASAKKWDEIAEGTGYSEGPDNCPLCQLFYEKSCAGCPVKQNTGNSCCIGSPYDIWEDLDDSHKRIVGYEHEYAKSALAVTVAKAEANYLRALIPRRRKAIV